MNGRHGRGRRALTATVSRDITSASISSTVAANGGELSNGPTFIDVPHPEECSKGGGGRVAARNDAAAAARVSYG